VSNQKVVHVETIFQNLLVHRHSIYDRFSHYNTTNIFEI
jgi:hypothetical protein